LLVEESDLIITHGVQARDAFDRARALFEECVAFHRAIGDHEGVGVGLLGLADIARDQGNVAQMKQYGTESLAIVRELQVHWAVGVVLNILALAAYLEGDLPRAFAFSNESVSMLRVQQADGFLAEVLMTLSQIERAQGDTLSAYKTVTEALQLASAVGPRVALVAGLEEMASLVVSPQQAKLATQLLAVAAALRLQMGTPVRPVDQAKVQQALATAQSALGAEAVAAVWEEAQTLPLKGIAPHVARRACRRAQHGNCITSSRKEPLSLQRTHPAAASPRCQP
jgi:hypothetical protein